jgi:N-acetylglucosaminyl-diphospho-decaprenol L-rhamnosyltransferase
MTYICPGMQEAAGVIEGVARGDVRRAPGGVSLVIVSHESGHVLGDCLSCAPADCEIIVADNGSADDSVNIARRCGARVLRVGENAGYARASNLGAAAASGEFVLFLNPDVRLERGAITALVAAARRYPGAAAFAPQLVNPDGTVFYRDYSLLCSAPRNKSTPKRPPVGDCSVEMLIGAALMCRRQAFIAIGGFDERIFLYYEDDDICRRLRQAGWSLVHVHDAVVRHEGGKSTRPGCAGTYFRSFHWAVSKTYVSRKHGVPLNPALEWRKAIVRGWMAALRGNLERRERYFGLASGYKAVMQSGAAWMQPAGGVHAHSCR